MARRPRLNQIGAADAAARIAAGTLTSEALVRACLERIEEREADVMAWAFVDPDLALAQARARDGESPRGPLHGVPVGIKDNIDTEDMPTEYGSKLYAGHRPVADAAKPAPVKTAQAEPKPAPKRRPRPAVKKSDPADAAAPMKTDPALDKPAEKPPAG